MAYNLTPPRNGEETTLDRLSEYSEEHQEMIKGGLLPLYSIKMNVRYLNTCSHIHFTVLAQRGDGYWLIDSEQKGTGLDNPGWCYMGDVKGLPVIEAQ